MPEQWLKKLNAIQTRQPHVMYYKQTLNDLEQFNTLQQPHAKEFCTNQAMTVHYRNQNKRT